MDDPFDGTAGGTPNDTLNTDYKLARVEVSWQAALKANPIVLLMNVAPLGIEGGTSAGTLSFQALNANGQPVPDADVTLVNGNVSPVVNIATQTDDAGRVVLPGLPASNRYQLAVSRPGYTSEQTYTASGPFTPDANHSQLTMIVGQVTSKTFFIDLASTVNVYTQDENGQPLPGIGYTFQGTKTYGTTSNKPTYYVNTTQSTDAAGKFVHSGLIWDSYAVTLSDNAYDIVQSNLLLPLAVDPGTEQDLILTLGSHKALSLHMHATSPTHQLIKDATVELAGFGYDQTLVTGTPGQVFFGKSPDLPQTGNYTLTVTADGYQTSTQTVNIQGSTTMTVALTPNP